MADIHTETVSYSANGTTLKGFLAHDPDAGARAGVLIVHEWWGLDDYIRQRARMLAELGYSAMAVDMYGGGRTAADPSAAAELMNAALADIEAMVSRFEAARDLLAGHAATDGSRLGAIGYCFGGAVVLHMARIGMALNAVASFHGSLGSFHTPAKGEVKAKILVCHGAADSLVPDADVSAFKAEMDKAGADYTFNAYDGALHGFSNPAASANGKQYGLPLAYDEAADRQSWSDMQALFSRSL